MTRYTCPLTCREVMSAPALSGHLRMQAGTLGDEVRYRYMQLGVEAVYADRCEEEITAQMANAYRAVTGAYPAWGPDRADLRVPEWLDLTRDGTGYTDADWQFVPYV